MLKFESLKTIVEGSQYAIALALAGGDALAVSRAKRGKSRGYVWATVWSAPPPHFPSSHFGVCQLPKTLNVPVPVPVDVKLISRDGPILILFFVDMSVIHQRLSKNRLIPCSTKSAHT